MVFKLALVPCEITNWVRVNDPLELLPVTVVELAGIPVFTSEKPTFQTLASIWTSALDEIFNEIARYLYFECYLKGKKKW